MNDSLIKALVAAALALLGVLSPASLATNATAPTDDNRASKPRGGRKPKQDAPTAPTNDELDDSGLNDDELEGSGLNDGLDDDDEPEETGPTESDVRTALLAVKEKVSADKARELMKKAINNDTIAPSVKSIPVEKYKAVIDAANKLVSKAGK